MSKRTGKPNSPKSPWLHLVKAKRKDEAEKRQVAYNKLTVEQKLHKLDMGGYNALKQRAKLLGKKS